MRSNLLEFAINDIEIKLIIFNGRKDRIWTCDPSVPNRVLYQAKLLSDKWRAQKDSNPQPLDP